MNSVTIVLYICIFAVITAALYVWGLKRSITYSDDINRMLLSKCSKKVIKYLSENNTISEKDIDNLIKNTKVGLFWSKNKLIITDGKKYSKELINFMLENKYIIKNANTYILYK